MNLLKESVAWMKEQKDEKYRKAIDQEEELLKNYIDRYKSLGKGQGHDGRSKGKTASK
jgi:hypothetical protein